MLKLENVSSFRINMEKFCEICDKSNKLKSKNNHVKSVTHNDFEKSILKNHTIKNPNSSDKDEIKNYYITNHNKKLI